MANTKSSKNVRDSIDGDLGSTGKVVSEDFGSTGDKLTGDSKTNDLTQMLVKGIWKVNTLNFDEDDNISEA